MKYTDIADLTEVVNTNALNLVKEINNSYPNKTVRHIVLLLGATYVGDSPEACQAGIIYRGHKGGTKTLSVGPETYISEIFPSGKIVLREPKGSGKKTVEHIIQLHPEDISYNRDAGYDKAIEILDSINRLTKSTAFQVVKNLNGDGVIYDTRDGNLMNRVLVAKDTEIKSIDLWNQKIALKTESNMFGGTQYLEF